MGGGAGKEDPSNVTLEDHKLVQLVVFFSLHVMGIIRYLLYGFMTKISVHNAIKKLFTSDFQNTLRAPL